MTHRLMILIAVCGLVLGACDNAAETVQGLRDRIADIDIDATLDGLHDCDAVSERFVGLVEKTADAIDGLAEKTDGRVSATQIREAVDKIAVSRYFDIAEAIGCAQLQQRLDTIEQLRDIAPDTPAGDEFLKEVIERVEQS